ncbi:MAG: EamA family transporter, partial [Pseudomonadota bacterium]
MATASSLRVLAITILAMVAFAANSVIGRLGLLEGDAGAGTFALIRLVSGALTLLLICGLQRTWRGGDWASGIALFGYAAFFSYAYLSLDAGAGALILFAIVQLTMVGSGLWRGERLGIVQWAGFAIALAALAWWLWPNAGSPDLFGVCAMAVAGVSWGAYSLYGLGTSDPIQRTAGNFTRAAII